MEKPLFSALLPLLLLAFVSHGLVSWAWTTPDCTIADSSLLANLSYYIPFCSLAPRLHLFASCSNVKDVAQTLRAVPRDREVLCLQGIVPVLPANAFGDFPSLRLLRLQLGNLKDIQLPISLTCLTLRHSCLTKLQELKGLFPNLLHGFSPTASPRPLVSFLEVLDLSSNLQLSQGGIRSLDGLQMHSLRLDSTPLSLLGLLGSGLLHLDFLSLVGTGVTKLPGSVAGYFALRALDLGRNQIQKIEDADLASCYSLELLSLHDNDLQSLPIGFLSALPQLQRLNLSMNNLGSTLVLPDGLVSTNLRVLDLSYNEFCNLPYGVFSFLPQLPELWLGRNNLSNLTNGSLEGLRWLKTLDLSWNQIKILNPGWLSSLPALTSLNLLGTYLEYIPGKQFQGPHKLSYLQLGSLLELQIYPPWPPALLSLEVWATTWVEFIVHNEQPFLFLENLTLQTSFVLLHPSNATVYFPSLRHLTLRGVSPYIFSSHRPQKFFPQLPLLEHLHFWSDNGDMENMCLFGMARLQVLELGDLNFLSEFGSVKLETFLQEVPQLQVLALSHLNLWNLSMSTFKDLGHLRLLLFNSELTLGLDSSLQELIPQMPQYVYFSNVTFTCQCESSWVGSQQLCVWAGEIHLHGKCF
ncbi:Toll-like receptor 11 [Heterocephalus glaber]|uniref:Toll-like receptor 11 n=1 Tax=Heterocephalus glaber TaxID=10181 RepID=G5C1X1_HETGA|nr:Toll-like receptor 11 [Heterocephalus glaber]